MTIRDKQSFTEGLPDWSCLDGCFGATRISPTDVDGLVERRGALLMLEWKRPGGELRQGQRITLLALCKYPRCAGVVVWGTTTPMAPERMQLFWNGKAQDVTPADMDKVRSAVSRWFAMADRDEPTPTLEPAALALVRPPSPRLADEAAIARMSDKEKPRYLARCADSRETFEALCKEYAPRIFRCPTSTIDTFWLVETRARDQQV